MDYRIIKQVLNIEDKSSEEKLAMIEKITDRFAAIDKYARELAEDRGRQVTIEDRYQAARRVADEIGISLKKREAEIKNLLQAGADHIIADQTASGGWGRRRMTRVPHRIQDLIPKDHEGPVPSAWVTCVALSTLQSVYNFYHQLPEIEEAIRKGLNWLIDSQNPNGSWNDVDPKICDSPINIIQTGMAISGLVTGVQSLQTDALQESIRKGLHYLSEAQNRASGGWASMPEIPESETDSKATSMAVISCLLASKVLGINFPQDDRFAREGVKWLIENQLDEGDWGYATTPDSFLFGAYYGIEALEFYRMLNQEGLSTDPQFHQALTRAHRKAINWYITSNQLVRVEEKYGWAWVNGDRTGEIANTASAITVLLDCAEDDFSFVIRKGIDYLLAQRYPNIFWEGDTALVLMSLVRYINPDSRIHNLLQLISSAR
jgi:squalene cyclase